MSSKNSFQPTPLIQPLPVLGSSNINTISNTEHAGSDPFCLKQLERSLSMSSLSPVSSTSSFKSAEYAPGSPAQDPLSESPENTDTKPGDTQKDKPYFIPIPNAFSPLAVHKPSKADLAYSSSSFYAKPATSWTSPSSSIPLSSPVSSSAPQSKPKKKSIGSSISMFSAAIKKYQVDHKEKKRHDSAPVVNSPKADVLGSKSSPAAVSQSTSSFPGSPRTSSVVNTYALMLSEADRPKSLQFQPFLPSQFRFRQYQQQHCKDARLKKLHLDLKSTNKSVEAKQTKSSLSSSLSAQNLPVSNKFSSISDKNTTSGPDSDIPESPNTQRFRAIETERHHRLQNKYQEYQTAREENNKIRREHIEFRVHSQRHQQKQRTEVEKRRFRQELRNRAETQKIDKTSKTPLVDLSYEQDGFSKDVQDGLENFARNKKNGAPLPLTIKSNQSMAYFKRKSRGNDMMLLMEMEFESINEEEESEEKRDKSSNLVDTTNQIKYRRDIDDESDGLSSSSSQ